MVDALIFQIAGVSRYERRKYRVESDESGTEVIYEEVFSSTAVARHLLDSGKASTVKIIFLVPDTILADPNIGCYMGKFIEMVESGDVRGLEELTVRACKEYMRKNSHIRDLCGDNLKYEFVGMKGMGSYTLKNNSLEEYKVVFRRTDEDITFNIYKIILDILDCKREGGRKIYIDISTGWNNYIPLMLDAVSTYITFDKLRTLGDSDRRFHLIISEPGGRGVDNALNIYIREFDTRVLFKWPSKEELRIYQRSIMKRDGEGGGDDRNDEKEDIFKNASHFLSTGRKLYNSIIYNIPLLLFKDAFEDGGIINFEYARRGFEILVKVTNTLSNNMVDKVRIGDMGFEITPRNHVIWHIYKNFVTTVGIIDGLVNKLQLPLEDPYIEVVYNDDNDYKVQHSFEKIMDIYSNDIVGRDINKRFLEKDINDLASYIGKLKTKSWVKYSSLDKMDRCYGGDNKKIHVMSSDSKRNFFAHSGLSKDHLLLKRCGNRILLRYDTIRKREIEGFIKNPK